MKSRWSSREAEAACGSYAEQGVGKDLALRIYTTRLLGGDPQLVIHGGGNTSVKTRAVDLLGDEHEVLCVKGSGWDMATIEAEGLPAVRLRPLLRTRERASMSDEEMVALQRVLLLDSRSPNPSVETLLHAFLPHKYVDHTHATAVLTVSDQPRGEAICREIYGASMGYVPFIMPGFQLAKKAAEVYRANPDVEGLILHKHGIFTFGDSARQAYERMIEMVSRAEDFIRLKARKNFTPAVFPGAVAEIAEVAPRIRGACDRLILDFRGGEEVLSYVNGAELTSYAGRGVITPDHIIRTKNRPLVASFPDATDMGAFARELKVRVGKYVEQYHEYFRQNNVGQDPPKIELDPHPRVVLVPGLGLFGLGKSKREAVVAADLAEITVRCITDAESIGRFEALPESDLFAMEYWSLEQAKLGKSAPLPLARQVALITGAAGTIGEAVARLFAAQGAEVVLLDRDEDGVRKVADAIGGDALAIACDVTDADSTAAAWDRACETFGGVDILVSNVGAAFEGPISTLDDATLRNSFELNFFAHQRMAQHAVRIMRMQGRGGVLLFNASKQAINPGANFGAYGLPKAATLFLSRQYALECGKDGIRSNAVNADRIRSGVLTPEMISKRSGARGLSEEEYMSGNLLGLEVTADDVAQAFLHQALARKTTAGVTTVDGGNIPAALR